MWNKTKRKGYSNAYYRDIPCFYNESTKDIEGRNWFYDILLEIDIWIDTYILEVEEYAIVVDKEDKDGK